MNDGQFFDLLGYPKPLRHMDTFSGAGGWALAAHKMGWETVVFCEKEKFCQKLLAKHWPNVPIVDDIHKLKGNEYGTIDVLTTSCPCQPFSTAGKQGGTDDDRHLWPEAIRVIKEARPRWVIFENVPGIVNMAIDIVLSDLENEGYSCQTFNIPACSLNAIHKRERIWVVGHAKHAGLSGS